MTHVVQPDHVPALTGPVRDLTGLAHAQAIPTVPTVAHANPTWDWTRLAIWGTLQMDARNSNLTEERHQKWRTITLSNANLLVLVIIC